MSPASNAKISLLLNPGNTSAGLLGMVFLSFCKSQESHYVTRVGLKFQGSSDLPVPGS